MEANDESDLVHDHVTNNPEIPALWDVSYVQNVPRWIHPSQRSKKQAEKLIVIVCAMEWRSIMGTMKMWDIMS